MRPVLNLDEYRLLFKANPQPMWIFDVETLAFVAVNDAAVRLYGYSEQEFLSMTIKDIRPAEDVPLLLARVPDPPKRLGETETWRHRKKDGTVMDVELATQQFTLSGRVVRYVLINDVTERARAEEAVRFQARLLDAVQQGVIATDLEGKILYWNRFAETLYGWTADEVLGREITEVTPSSSSRETALEILCNLSKGENWSGELELQRRDGTTFPALITDSPVYDQRGKLVGIIGISADITERRRADRERHDLLRREQEARAEAEAANRLKDEFLAILSHELRTPLNSIIGWADILRRGNSDPDLVTRAVEVIRRSAQAQSKIIEDLVDLSRIIGGKLEIAFVAVQLVPVIEAAVDTVRPQADAKRLHVETDFRLPGARVSGDPTRLQQVIWNLLSNAVKFTSEGGRVSIRLEQSGSEVVLTVSDTGKGIAAEFLPYVFERFRQADSSTTRRQSGLGLGLAIVRQLVELHHGTVTAYSAGEGQGSTFTVRLPLINASRETG